MNLGILQGRCDNLTVKYSGLKGAGGGCKIFEERGLRVRTINSKLHQEKAKTLKQKSDTLKP